MQGTDLSEASLQHTNARRAHRRYVLVAIIGLALVGARAEAVPTWGYQYATQVYAAPNSIDTYTRNATTVVATTFSTSNTQTGLDSVATARAVLTNDGQNVGLHIGSSTTSANFTSVYANDDLLFFDTFHFTGPANQTGRIQFTLTLEGLIDSPLKPTGTVQAFLHLTSNTFGNPCPPEVHSDSPLHYVQAFCVPSDLMLMVTSNGSFSETGTFVYQVAAGSTYSFGLNLGQRNSFEDGTSIVDFLNTGYMQVASLDGLGYTTDTGFTYVNPPNQVSEPAPLALLLPALIALAVSSRRNSYRLR